MWCLIIAVSAAACALPDSTGHLSTLFPVAAPFSTNGVVHFQLIALYLIFTGAVFSAGVGNLIFYISRRRERAHLFLAATCLSVGADVVLWLISTAPDGIVAPDINRQLLLRLDFFAIIVAIGSSNLLMQSIFPLDYSRWFTVPVAVVCVFLFPWVPFAPHTIINRLFVGFMAVIILFIAYSLYIAIRSLVLKRPSVTIFALACFAVFSAGAVDGLVVLKLLPPVPTLLPFGLTVFAYLVWFSVGYRYNTALVQSEKLHAELSRKARTEQHLRMVQRRLAEFLDKVPFPVCAIDENSIVQFVNSPAAERFAGTSQSLVGSSIDCCLAVVPEGSATAVPFSEQFRGPDLTDRQETAAVAVGAADGDVPMRLEIIPVVLEDEELSILIVHDAPVDPPEQCTIGLVIAELTHNRERLRKLDRLVEVCSTENDAGPALLQELRAVSDGLEHLSQSLAPSGLPDDRRELALVIMTHAVAYWEMCTGKSKMDLLRESGLWRVETTPDGFERSKTLERYLSRRLFPKNPRWKKVLATGDFVLLRCSDMSEDRTILESAMSRLRLL